MFDVNQGVKPLIIVVLLVFVVYSIIKNSMDQA